MSESGSMQLSAEAARTWCAVHSERAMHLRQALAEITEADTLDLVLAIARDAIHDDNISLDIAENGEREAAS